MTECIRTPHISSLPGLVTTAPSCEETRWMCGVVSAVEERYGLVAGETAGVDSGGIQDLQHEIGARFVEVVGFDKVNREQSDLTSLRTVSLCGMGVRGRWE